ncbi:STAS domain-containing protein [Aquimarina sp. D1M17]|uniref:STAS domain-containing protein n=1 Tax=Aquimarina acroporae TaxID=2937283 RepID=UPI0020BDB7F7|nr:STAS domain-containing protein [Aquimarina acroporae]MCK8521340.1 STAS domain-containing protein [Aquimarina acroporae]
MVLSITKNQGVFEINGSIVAENAQALQYHFEQLLFCEKQVILSVDQVKKIDVSGVNALSNLYKRAIKSNKLFYIIGKENKNVRKAFYKVNSILKKEAL